MASEGTSPVAAQPHSEDTSKHDQLPVAEPDTNRSEPPAQPQPQPRASSPNAIARARRTRWTAAGEQKLRDVVDIVRNRERGHHTVSDDYGYIGKIQRQVHVSGARGRWQAYDATNHLLDTGPWDTVDKAAAGLLGDYLDREQRRTRRKR